jgi:cytochrome c556
MLRKGAARPITLAVLKAGHAETTAHRTVPLGGIHERAEYPSPVLFQRRGKACILAAALFLSGGAAFAQAPDEAFPAVANVKQLMLDLIHPSSNDILLAIYRGGPKDEKDWAAVRRSAVTLAESGNMLMMRGRARDRGDWMKDAKLLVDAGNAAYKAAQAKDAAALAAVAGSVDLSCTTCHKQYRPNVFPKDGGSK